MDSWTLSLGLWQKPRDKSLRRADKQCKVSREVQEQLNWQELIVKSRERAARRSRGSR